MRAAAVFAAAVLCVSPALAAEGGVFRKRIPTADGVALAMYRYTPPGGGRAHPPVLLVADFGFGRGLFDTSGFGLAPWLRARGREVFVLELRGHGASGGEGNWRLSDVVRYDLPAAVAAIRKQRKEQIDLVVHGYSGALALASTVRELRGEIRRVVALNVPAEVEAPNAYATQVLEGGGRIGSLAMDPEGAAVFRLLFAHRARITRGRYAELSGSGSFDLGAGASKDLLTWVRSGELTLADGSSVRGRLAEYDRPTLQLLALRDNWVHAEAASPLRDVATRADVRVRLLSLLQYYAEDYSHLSLLQGDGAPRDVFPMVLQFLDAKEPRTPAPTVAEEQAP